MSIPDPFPPVPQTITDEQALEIWRWKAAIAITAAIAGSDPTDLTPEPKREVASVKVAAIALAGIQIANTLVDLLAKGAQQEPQP